MDARIEVVIPHARVGTGTGPTAVPRLLVELLGEFHRHQISYCYWKSTRRLAAIFAGEGDVDLLVDRADQYLVEEILLKRDFKAFPSAMDRNHPGLLSFFGYDEDSGQLIHIHMHFSLLLGERLLKNYRVPWERIMLSRAVSHPTLPIRILDPASEALLLIVRASLELRLFDLPGLWHWRSTSRNLVLDRAELAKRVERDALRALTIQVLGEQFADLVVDALYGQAGPERRADLRRAIRRHCAAYRNYNAIESRARSLARGLGWAARSLNKQVLHAPRMSNRCAPAGGLMVALVGVDGSGKSTALAAIKNWLGSKFDVIPMYFGTGDGRASLWLWPFKLILPIVVRILRRHQHRGGRSRIGFQGHAPSLPYQVLLMGWAIAVALDKRRKLKVARRAVSRGFIVLADRYPQSQIATFNDGPILTRLRAAPDRLRRFEADVYRTAQQLPPNLLIKLVAREDTIGKREPGMDPALVHERVAALRRLQFPGTRVVHVDAEKPLAEVIGTIKREIWRSL
jgi:hypothetical protein